MKIFAFLLVCTALTFASDDGCTETGVHVTPPPEAGNATITLTLIDSWSVTWAAKALGLDCFEDGSTTYVLGTSNTNMYVAAFDPVTGTGTGGTMPLDPANASCFGSSERARDA